MFTYQRTLCVVALILSTVISSFAQSAVENFQFNSRKIEVGIVYHYVKTNIDGTKPEYVSQYVAAKDRLEAFKFHPKGARAALVIAYMDWGNFSAGKLESWQVFANEKKLFATLTYIPQTRSVEVSIPAIKKEPEQTAIPFLPFHVYNFDFGSLNFSFRHLRNPRSTVVIGVADPTFKQEGPLFAYRGEATIVFEREELREGVLSRKYRIDGAGLNNRGGHIWVHQRLGHIVDMEIDLPDNPDWQSFKFKLLRIEKMTAKQWLQFMQRQF